jgi:hypothetical protein
MPLGFNSNVQVSGTLYHVQTEDRGAAHPFIDTVVLVQGRVLHRRSTSYEDLLAGGAADPGVLRARVEQQHREIVAALRAGSLRLGEAVAEKGPIEIRLLNPAAWLAAGLASLDIEVRSRGNGGPVAGAEVRVRIEGMASTPLRFAAQSDAQGRARVQFPVPQRPTPGAPVLVIGARTAQGSHQIRYRLKSRHSASPPR